MQDLSLNLIVQLDATKTKRICHYLVTEKVQMVPLNVLEATVKDLPVVLALALVLVLVLVQEVEVEAAQVEAEAVLTKMVKAMKHKMQPKVSQKNLKQSLT